MCPYRGSIRLITALLAALPTLALQALQAPDFFSPLTESTLTGVWEAIVLDGNELVYVEIGKDKRSFLAEASSNAGRDFVFVYPLESYSIAGSEVTLHFVQPNPGGGAVTISGTGHATDMVGGGLIMGRMVKGDKVIQKDREPTVLDIVLKRGTEGAKGVRAYY